MTQAKPFQHFLTALSNVSKCTNQTSIILQKNVKQLLRLSGVFCMRRWIDYQIRAPPLFRKSGTYFQIFGGNKMRNQADKIFRNFFLKGQGSPAIYQIPLISEIL